VLRAFEHSGPKRSDIATHRIGISEILYGIGGAIVFLGIAILIGQNWDTLGNGTKILATLGSGVASLIVGILLGREEKLGGVSQAFYFISALVMPTGLTITLDIAGYAIYDTGSQSVISGILLATYLLCYFLFRKNVFLFFNVIFGTWFFFSFTSHLVGGNPIMKDWDFFEYRTLLTGLTYMLLGYSFSETDKRGLTGALYGFGVMAFLGAALALGKWEPNQNIFWELLFPGLVFSIIFLSIHLKSKAFLTFGSTYLMAYILKITAEYFKDGLGWPLALVLAGFLLIGVGYYSFYLNKKYITQRS